MSAATTSTIRRGFQQNHPARVWIQRLNTVRHASAMSLKRPNTADGSVSPPQAKRKVVTTTTSRAVANFFRPASEKEPEKITFRTVHDTVLIARYDGVTTNLRPPLPQGTPVKLAAFDFDSTLVATKSGNRFARNTDDWQWWHASVPGRLKQLHEDGYVLLVMTNQAGVSLRSDSKTPLAGMKSLTTLKGRIAAALSASDLPMAVYAATEEDSFRKPRTGMWAQMLKDHQLAGDADAVDRDRSVFVGDAAGRGALQGAGVRKDHSCSDRDFAANLGIPFHTPEEYFLGEDAAPFVRPFDPASYLDGEVPPPSDPPSVVFAKKNPLDIVLFCGSPGAGKSTFYWRHLQPLGYQRVNQDILKSRDKCMKVAANWIDDRQSVVVDNTNADIETRAAWVALAGKMKVPIRLVHFTAPAKLCEHNDTVRALSGGMMNPEKRSMLPRVAFTGFAARYREPTISEGFQDITKVDFKFDGTEEEKLLWKRFWLS